MSFPRELHYNFISAGQIQEDDRRGKAELLPLGQADTVSTANQKQQIRVFVKLWETTRMLCGLYLLFTGGFLGS